MTKEQRYDPKEQTEKIIRASQRQEEEVDRLRAEIKKGREASESSEAIRHLKARHTDVKRAQKADELNDWPADSNYKLGSSYFMRFCSSCHLLDYDSRLRTNRGSDLYFKRYSQPMLRSLQHWHSKNLRIFLLDPNRLIPGNKCGLEPIKNDAVAADLIQFLKELTLANYSVIRSMVVNYYN